LREFGETSELKRLKALRRLQLLDSPASPSYDRITRLAASALNVPITLVSLIDESRQWFKSHFGINVTETPRDISFCAYAVRDQEPLIVPDAALDTRFANNPLVTGYPQIRFYAGVPLFTHDGLALGTLCAIDRRPRHLSYEALEVLEDFAAIVEDLIAGQESRIRRQECVAYATERDRLLQKTVDAMPVGVVRASPSGRLRSVNAWARDLLRSDVRALVALAVREIILPKDWAVHGAEIERVMAGTLENYKAHLHVVRQDGGSEAVYVHFYSERLTTGEAGYVVMLLDDCGR
jgi:diguanylate cyclase